MKTKPPVIAMIPARLGSTRFPGKVLAAKTGKPLIQYAWQAAMSAWTVSRVVVATDDALVARAVQEFGGEAVLTSVDHPNGSSRLAEAARILKVPGDALIVNVQGDEPEMNPPVIDLAVGMARASNAEVTTVASPFAPGEDPADPNIVKVVLRADSTALYFSRANIPFHRAGGDGSAHPLRHVGLYVYRADFLQTYVSLPATPLERTEMLEQLRVLERGYRIAVAVAEVNGQGIDTPEQYERFVERMNAYAGSARPANSVAKSAQNVG